MYDLYGKKFHSFYRQISMFNDMASKCIAFCSRIANQSFKAYFQ